MKPVRIILNLGNDQIRIFPPIWPDHKLNDLTQFAPNGNGLYGYQRPQYDNPLLSGPSQEPNGGVIFFDNKITREDFGALLRILNIPAKENVCHDYAAFTASSQQPSEERYLSQLRIVSKFGLRFMFNALTETEYEHFPKQPLSIEETLWQFVEAEKTHWGTNFWDNQGLSGLFGGDGDFAREELSFGLMVENDYYHIYRIWSRAWLVTK
jgi:hypothetical protein